MSSRRPLEPEIAVLVDATDVARAAPAVANRRGVGVGPNLVAGERLVGGHVAEDISPFSPSPQTRVQCRPARAAPASPPGRVWTQ